VADARGERIAANEKQLRDVNERIAEKTDIYAKGGLAPQQKQADFLCACGRPDCNRTITMTVEEFESAHAREDQVVVAPGHENPEIEAVVGRGDGYLVVRKKRGYKPDDVT
jgi:hypothetical protein